MSTPASTRALGERRWAAGLALVLVSCLAAPALGKPAKKKPAPAPEARVDETKDAARTMAREALQLMHQGRWAEAQSLLARAYRLVPAPTIALLEGKSFEQMGKLVEARERYIAAQQIPPGEPSGVFADAAREAAQRLPLLEKRIPLLSIHLEQEAGDARNPSVLLDGIPLSREQWAVPRQVNPGEHVVSASLEGGVAVEDHVLVRESETKDVQLRLFRPVPVPLVSTRPPPEPERSPLRTVGFVSLGVGAAGLATGVVAGLMMLDAKKDLDAACAGGCPPSAESDLSRFRTTRVVSAVGYGIGIVGLGAGAGLLLFGSSKEAEPTGTVRIGMGLGSAYVRGSF